MLGNGILETTTGATTGDLTVSGVSGRPRFSDFFVANATEANADIFHYSILTQDTIPVLVEQGIGWLSATGTLKRATVLVTYSGGVPTYMPGTPFSLSSGSTYNVICSPEAAALSGAPLHDTRGTIRGIGVNHYRAPVSAGSIVKDRLVYIPIFLNSPRRVVSIRANNGATVGAGGTNGWRIGLYSCLKNGAPGRKLLESGNITSTSFGAITYSFSATRLMPGWYYGALVHDYSTTVPTVYANANGAAEAFGNTPAGLGGQAGEKIIGLYEALSSGWSSMPSVASGSPTGFISGNGIYCPYFCMGFE